MKLNNQQEHIRPSISKDVGSQLLHIGSLGIGQISTASLELLEYDSFVAQLTLAKHIKQKTKLAVQFDL